MSAKPLIRAAHAARAARAARWSPLVATLATLATLAVSTSARSARAAAPELCLDAYDSAQRLRRESRLRAAEEQLVRCAQAECPSELRKDCLQWLADVRQSMPSIVVHAIDATGCDLVTGRVSVDGEGVTERLDGRPLSLDPGVHTVRVERELGASNAAALTQQIVLSTGEKNRLVTVSFAPSGATCGVTAAPIDRRQEQAPPRSAPALAYIVGAVGIVTLGVSSAFYASAWSKKGSLDDSCRPHCATDDVDSMRRSYLAGDVFLGVGLLSLGAATLLYLTR